MKKYLFISLLLIISGLTGFGQQIRVLDKSDLQPISQVNITNENRTMAVTTDQDGKADISVFGDNDLLIFSHVAYQTGRFRKTDIPASRKVYMTDNIIRLDEFVISGNRVEEKRSDLPYKIEVIQAREIAFDNPQTAAIMLEQTGQVFVQQSQLGGGSPVIRGLEANKVLMVIDGVRMNNAIYRSGHLQNAITVDPISLGSTEILYGPGSVIYGSDALGGVINFITANPTLSATKQLLVKGSALLRYASANQEKTGGFNLSLGLKKWGFLTSFSYSDFDDLREGTVYNPAYGDWGKCLYYAAGINGKDSMMVNEKPQIQKNSGYSQYNFMEKIMFRPDENQRYTFNFQYSNSSDIPRYDRLSEMDGSTGKLKYAEWYYGPQERLMGSFNADIRKNAVIFDQMSVTAGYQLIRESRINRKFDKTWKKLNNETVDVWSLNADFTKKITKKDDLRYGLEIFYNNVKSTAHEENVKTGESKQDIATRYPDQKANMMTVAAYLSNLWKLGDRLQFSQGIRYSYVALNAAWSDTMMSIMKFPFSNDVAQRNNAFNGYLGLTWNPGHDWKFSVIGSSGFRAPNIDDIGKVNDSNSQDQLIIVPNPELNPEYAYNLELSAGKTIVGSVRLEGSFFYTWLTDAIVLAPYEYNGQDSIMYDGVLCKVEANTNAGKAHIYGFQANLLAQVTPVFSVRSNLTYTVGTLTTGDVPLDHIPPFFGMTSFRLELTKFKGDFYVMYNGWKRLSQYSPSGEDNLTYATPYGMPSWYTLNLKLSYQFLPFLNLELGMENILDEHYRKFASGISSPGRNVIVALRANF